MTITSVRDFIRNSNLFEQIQANSFATHFGVTLERIPQSPGCVGDYIVTSVSELSFALQDEVGPLLNRTLEFKNDKTSLKYNSFFVEFESTSDWWNSKYESGHQKAINSGCLLCLNSGRDMYIFNQESFEELCSYSVGIRQTKFRSNGNRPESRSKGMIIPLKSARVCVSFLYRMP